MTKSIIDAIFLDENDVWLEHKWVAYIGPKDENGKPFTHDWKEYKGTVAIPKGCKKIRVSLQDYGPGEVMFDDVVATYEADVSKVTDALSRNEVNPNADNLFVPPAISEPTLAAEPTLANPLTSNPALASRLIKFKLDLFPMRLQLTNQEKSNVLLSQFKLLGISTDDPK